MHQRRADERRARAERGDAGYDTQLGRVAALPSDVPEHLEDQARHPVNARVARRNQRDLRAVARPLHRGARAANLLGHPGADDLLARDQFADQLDVGDVADDHLGIGDRRESPPAWRDRARRDRFPRRKEHPSRQRISDLRFHRLVSLNGTRATASVIERPAPGSVYVCLATSSCSAPAQRSAAGSATPRVPTYRLTVSDGFSIPGTASSSSAG